MLGQGSCGLACQSWRRWLWASSLELRRWQLWEEGGEGDRHVIGRVTLDHHGCVAMLAGLAVVGGRGGAVVRTEEELHQT